MTEPDLNRVKQVPASPKNYTGGRDKHAIKYVVIHVMDGTLVGTDAWFQNPKAQVSAHYGIGNHGELHQYVNETDTAWHAGVWETNQESIGIEHEGMQPKEPPYWVPTEKQLMVSAELAARVCIRYGITPTPRTILRHSSVNPDHALCPGPGFPLDQYIGMVLDEMARIRSVVTTTPHPSIPVRLFDPATRKQIGTGTLIGGTDKVYVKKEAT